MTANQQAYQNLLLTARRDAETARSNRVREAEAERSNKMSEMIDWNKLAETVRANTANQSLATAKLGTSVITDVLSAILKVVL